MGSGISVAFLIQLREYCGKERKWINMVIFFSLGKKGNVKLEGESKEEPCGNWTDKYEVRLFFFC